MRCFIVINPLPAADGLIYAHFGKISSGLLPVPKEAKHSGVYALDYPTTIPTLQKKLREFCQEGQFKIFVPYSARQQQQQSGTHWVSAEMTWVLGEKEMWLKKRGMLSVASAIVSSEKTAPAQSKTSAPSTNQRRSKRPWHFIRPSVLRREKRNQL